MSEQKGLSPATLTPADTDEHIVTTLAAFPENGALPPLARVRTIDGEQQVWSRRQMAWVTVAEYAAEWRRHYKYRGVMGDGETTRAVTRYEEGMGL